MKLPILSTLVSVAAVVHSVSAQDAPVYVVDPSTGFKFSTVQQKYDPPVNKGDLTMGFAFPKKGAKDEYVGYMVARRQGTPGGAGYTGISHSSGMLKSLLLVAWVNGQDIQTSWRYATKYNPPVKYTGPPPKLTKLATVVNASHYSLTYRCQSCLTWTQGGQAGNLSLSTEAALFSYAQGATAPAKSDNPDASIGMHNSGFGVLPAVVKDAETDDYEKLASTPAKGGVAPAKAPANAAPPAGSAPKASSSASPKASAPAPAKGKGSGTMPPMQSFRRI
ncbi:CBD9-like protein [Tothia fuscella]|uniref:CBD9-like protein n=1 Tax=Tothia fuscella TaxID=1048955 RepID=A0A9P4NHZ8_9PEZI|nr:CBD9-like protein [Tothia fuscella]